MHGEPAVATGRVTSRTTLATVVVADDRPLMRLGLRALLDLRDDVELAAACPVGEVTHVVGRTQPGLLVLSVRATDPDPFRVVAAATRVLPSLRVLVVADASSVVDLREAVLAGVDSFLLSTTDERELADALIATANGERVVSPEVAMQLAGSWRADSQGGPLLTPRELEVLQLLAEGLTNQEVGAQLQVSARTVKTHVQNLLVKLGTADRTGAVAKGFRLGLIR